MTTLQHLQYLTHGKSGLTVTVCISLMHQNWNSPPSSFCLFCAWSWPYNNKFVHEGCVYPLKFYHASVCTNRNRVCLSCSLCHSHAVHSSANSARWQHQSNKKPSLFLSPHFTGQFISLSLSQSLLKMISSMSDLSVCLISESNETKTQVKVS